MLNNIPKEYNQCEKESVDDWKYRIILGKARKEVKLSWSEICQLLDLSCSGEYIRKIAYGIMRYDNFCKEKDIESLACHRAQAKLNELESKEFEMRKEKMRMQDQKRELNKLLREWARAEHIKSEINKAIKEAASLKPISFKPKDIKTELGKTEAALLLSDWHKGQNSSNFLNVYNDVVFKKRIKKLVKDTITHCRNNSTSTLHVFALGDLINGLIHVTTRINNTEDVIKQSMVVSEILTEMITVFAENISNVKLHFARGNHDRVTSNKKESITSESFFDLVPWYLKARLSTVKNVEFVDNMYSDEIIVTEILGHKIFAVHGDKDRIGNVVQNLSLMLKQFPDYIFMGHYHHSAESEIHGASVIVNNALCGTDEYAMNIRSTSKAGQKLVIFNKEGRLCTYNIRLEV